MAALAEHTAIDSITLTGLPMPITLRLPVPLADEELLAFCRRIEPYRLERNAQGELEIMTPLVSRGGRRESYVIRQMDLWAEQNGGASFSSASGFSLPDGSMRCADAAWVADSRWSALTEEECDTFAPICPDFVVEVASKSDTRRALEAKMQMWIANGAQLAWMIDPFAATLSIYRPGAAAEVLTHPDWVEASTVVPGFRLETSRLWAK